MNLLMLSGNSLHNRDWIQVASTKLPPVIGSRVIQYYQHWGTGGEWIDLEREMLELKRQHLERIAPYGVFAKSIGTVLALQGMSEGIIKPSFLLLLGIPLNYVRDNYAVFSDKLATLDMPVTIIHNTHDTVGNSQDLKAFLGNSKHRLIEPEMSGHDYTDYDMLAAELQRLVAEAG